MAEDLVGLAVEDLVALRVLVARRHVGHRLDRLDHGLAVVGALVAGGLHRGLDDEERLPGGEHVGVGRDLLGVGDRGAVVVDADGGAVEGLELGGVRLLVAGVALPEVRAVEELEAGAGDVDGLERSMKPKISGWPAAP